MDSGCSHVEVDYVDGNRGELSDCICLTCGLNAPLVAKDLQAQVERLENSMELAWGLIANAVDHVDNKDWQEAMVRWRDNEYHPSLPRTNQVEEQAKAEGDQNE